MTNYPRFAYIEEITNALNALVTFTVPHDFTVGEIVSFRVGPLFGMSEINNKRAKVLAINTDDLNNITVDIDTSTWTPFSLANLDDPGTSPPICIPCASGVITQLYTPTVNIEDAFDNRR